MSAEGDGVSARKRKKRIWGLRVAGLRLRLAYYILPERFRGESAGVWVAQMDADTAQIEASTREIGELVAEINRSPAPPEVSP